MIMWPNHDVCAVAVVVAKLDYWITNTQYTNEDYPKALFEDNPIYAQAEYGVEVYCVHIGLRMPMDNIDINDIFAVVIEFGGLVLNVSAVVWVSRFGQTDTVIIAAKWFYYVTVMGDFARNNDLFLINC